MRSRLVLVLLLFAAAFSLAVFALVLRQLSFVSVALAAHDEVDAELRRSLVAERELARLDPAHTAQHRERFDSISALRNHLQVVQLNRREVARRVEQILFAAVAIMVACGVALFLLERRQRERRLIRLESAVDALSRGENDIDVGDRRRDVIGRIASAIEKSSREAAADRRRLRYLEHLSAWQEAARRHAHEMRTPLTAVRMDVERLAQIVRRDAPALTHDVDEARDGIFTELENLGVFIRRFTSFATIPRPRLQAVDLRKLVDDFCITFHDAWPGVALKCERGDAVHVQADGEMLRQVLANLAANSAMAIADRGGTVTFTIARHENRVTLDVTDDGAGIAPEIRTRLFEPYTTTRGIGEGMGLGLAISKKILLDHGGDLDLVPSERGARFRLTLPTAAENA